MLNHGWLNHAVTGGARHKHTTYKEPRPHCLGVWRKLNVHIQVDVNGNGLNITAADTSMSFLDPYT